MINRKIVLCFLIAIQITCKRKIYTNYFYLYSIIHITMFFNARIWLLTPIFYFLFLVSVGQKTEKWNQDNTKIPLPGTKKISGSSELQIAVPVSIGKSHFKTKFVLIAAYINITDIF